jgi:hypothetical protein
VPNLPYTLAAVHIDNVNGELHAKGMHRLARNDPEAFTLGQSRAPKQAPAAARCITGNINTSCKLRLPSPIDDAALRACFAAAMPGKE